MQDRIGNPAGQIVALERAPEMAGFDAHDRIGLRVERGVPAEHLDGDGIGLDAVAAPGKRFLHDIAQEPPPAIGRVELRTVKDAG